MLRIIFAILALTAVTSTAFSAQPLPTEWADWLVKNEPQVQKKQAGITFWSSHRQVCLSQKTDEKKLDCQAKDDVILGRLIFEKNLLSAMIDALRKLPTDEATVLVFTATPSYQKFDAETTEMSRRALELYPRQQASAT